MSFQITAAEHLVSNEKIGSDWHIGLEVEVSVKVCANYAQSMCTACVHMHMYKHTPHIHMHAHVHTQTHTSLHSCTYTSVHTHNHIYRYTYTYVYSYMWCRYHICTHTHTYMYVWMDGCVCVSEALKHLNSNRADPHVCKSVVQYRVVTAILLLVGVTASTKEQTP